MAHIIRKLTDADPEYDANTSKFEVSLDEYGRGRRIMTIADADNRISNLGVQKQLDADKWDSKIATATQLKADLEAADV